MKDKKKLTFVDKFFQNRWAYHIIVTTCMFVFMFCGLKIFVWASDNSRLQLVIENIQGKVDLVAIPVNPGDLVPGINIQDVPKALPEYVDVDFKTLKAQNSDFVGWLKVFGTNINFPTVMTKKDIGATSRGYYYLTHDFDKKKNEAGWVFGDPRNDYENLDNNRNIIFYAHNRRDGNMFGTLKNLGKSSFYDAADENGIISLTLNNELTLWQVFAYYVSDLDFNYIKVSFIDDNDFLSYYKTIREKNIVKALKDPKLLPTDKVLTLSTCKNDTQRIVVCAKLISRKAR